MKKPLINIFVVLQALITVSVFSQQTMVRPRIGLALSGGGAKGLAHIGILKAIDSAGLKIDYITGTSMGSIIGGLYAVGYSADSIEKITRATNWELLLSNQSSLRTLYMEEKEEYNKYTIELPWVKNRFELPTGLLQGQEIWVKLAELLFPVYNQKDFSKFSVPFRCVATDVGNGEAVVLGKGELSSAIRASMAIPSLFTAVEYDGRKLIDGGVIRNFPVKDVQELGADFVIGSNAAQTLLPSDKVRNAIQVLLQVAFFHEAQDHKEEIAKCDIYVSPDLSKYNMVSFGQSGEILDAGIAEGRKLYPKLKKLVDSLDAIYGKQAETKKQLPVVKSVIISSCEVKGLKNTNTDFFIHTINFLTNQAYTSQKLSKMVRAAFGTRYYSRIVYSLEPQSDGTCKIIFDVTENPLTFAKFGLHYNRFSGIAAIVNVTSRNLLLPNSRSLVTLNIGEAIRARAEHLQYIGRRKNFSFLLGMQYDRFNVLTYNTYKQDGLYKQQFFKADIKAQFSTQRNLTIGIGHRVESVKYKPKIIPAFQFSGSNIFGSTYFFIQHNSLDKIIYPGNGIRINSTFEYVGNQHPSVSFFINGIPVRSDSLKVSKKPYTRATFNMDAYKQLSRRTTAEFLIQSGINFNYSNNIMNEFVIGGLTRQFRNQVLFAGLLEGSLYSPAVAAIQTGLRYEVLNNTFVTCRGNILFNNFISKSDFFSNPDVATGYSVTFGYNFALGPLEFSLMYNDQSKKVNGYVNIGIVF